MMYFKKLSELHEALHSPYPEHPLFSLIEADNSTCSRDSFEFRSDFYLISLKKMKTGLMQYGKTKYDHDRGCMAFVKPGQAIAFRDIRLQETGFMIFFHEDFLLNHQLYTAQTGLTFFCLQKMTLYP